MINLLPPSRKTSTQFAKKNVILINRISLLLVGLLGILVIVIFSSAFIGKETSLREKDFKQISDRLENQNLEETKQRVKALSANVKLVVDVLSKEVLFSKLFKHLGFIMPNGAILQNLTIGELKGAIDITATATTYETATQVHVNIVDEANKIFDLSDIISVSCTEQSEESSSSEQYPCQITIRATFAKNNPFLLISKESS